MSNDETMELLSKSDIYMYGDDDNVTQVLSNLSQSVIERQNLSMSEEDNINIFDATSHIAYNIEDLKPRDYQEALVSSICENKDAYGRIISLETGLGKTFIALIFICKRLGIDYEKAPKRKRRPDCREKNREDNSLKIRHSSSRLRTKIIFLVPTKNLLEQQTTYFSNHLPKYFEVFNVKSTTEYPHGRTVFEQESGPTFVVMIHKVCLSLLRNGSMKIEQINFLIFDECHHCQKDHPYNLIMKEFYFYGLDFKVPEEFRYEKRPYILGLTASPIKNKIKQSDTSKFEMVEQMSDLCSNMNSKIVSVDLNLIDDSLVKKLNTEFIDYKLANYSNLNKYDLPDIGEFIEENEKHYEKEEFKDIMVKVEFFKYNIETAIKKRHELMGYSKITPEKITQVIANQYKEILENINFEEYSSELRVAILMTIGFYVYRDNILLNVGAKGLQIFIEEC
jgi:superfamily II DNA or RNA helicase